MTTAEPAVAHVGADDGRVSGFATSTHEIVARLFLPVRGAGDVLESWSELARQAGIPLTSTLTFTELTAALPPDEASPLAKPAGELPLRETSALVDVLRRATTTPTRCFFGLWEGSSTDLEGLEIAPFPPALDALAHRHGGLALHVAPLSWLVDRARRFPPQRMPVFVWPQDGSFLLGCPIYRDSLFVSCSRSTGDALRAAGFDVLPTALDDPVPQEWE